MAEVTPIDGNPINFDPSKVSAVADHDATTNEAVTTVYGITASFIRIDEAPKDFLDRLGITQNFAQLTRPNGNHVWINAKAVDSIREPLDGEYIPAVHTVIKIGSLVQGVAEARDTVVAALNSHGGHF